MILLPVTLVIAAAAGLINFWLAIRASRVRISDKVLFGDGGNPLMLKRMRAHANFAEYAPAILILMALIELARGPGLALWLIGIVFIVARLCHAFGMDSETPSKLRVAGASLTWLALLGLSGWALVIGYQAAAAQPVERTMTFAPAK
ncbi:MAG: MAPEG family protein [Pseudomonadota bacterium]